MFPRRKSIWLPLLKVLDEADGPLKPSEAVERVEPYFPELNDEDKKYTTPNGRLRWSEHDVAWARYDLVKAGLMLKTPGKWQLSEDGHAHLKAHWDTWAPEYARTALERSITTGDDDDPPPPTYWWVNQGQSYESERDGGYIWAPLHTKSGATLGHWERVSGVLPGDVLVHYSNGAVRAISIAEGAAEQRDNPHASSHKAWEDKGWAATVHYYELREPYGREMFPEGFKRMDIPDGPFDRTGQVKQGYLWGFSEEAFQILTGHPQFPWPLEVPLDRPSERFSTDAMATVFSQRGTSVAVALRIDSVWAMAREIAKVLPMLSPVPEEIKLVQKFLQTEISPNFELVNLLDHGIAVHHAGLSDDARALIEWLVEEEKVRVLCATTTIVQGINFPVSSVFLASRFVPGEKSSKEMSSRAFWNLAGRVGRIDHDSVGVIGVIAGDKPNETIEFVERKTGDLLSRLQTLLTELEEAGNLSDLESVIYSEQWEDFRCYVAHLWNSKRNLGAVLEDTEQLLRNTLGYNVLRSRSDGKAKADKLLEATKKYAQDLAKHPERATLADMTGFSVEGVSKALYGLSTLERKLDVSDWAPESLFGSETGMADLYGVMLRVPQLEESLRDIAAGNQHDSKILAEVTQSWVKGFSIEAIASMFQDDQPDKTKAITEAAKAIYRSLVTVGSWGFAALSQLAGLDYDSMSDVDRRRINILPAMVYHGVNTEEAVLMRMNAVPRSIAQNVGKKFLESIDGNQEMANVRGAREFLRDLDKREWETLRPETSHLNGSEYKKIWELLSGEGNGIQ